MREFPKEIFHERTEASLKRSETTLKETSLPRYGNLSRKSGVVAYRTAADSITVEFADGDHYLYTNESAGAENVERMKRLAALGKGLSTFISTTVRNNYARRW